MVRRGRNTDLKFCVLVHKWIYGLNPFGVERRFQRGWGRLPLPPYQGAFP
jgi:hypothetical protein